MIFHGLLQYGFNDEAKELALRTLRLALVANPVTREFYDSDTGKGNGMDPFWGWSSLVYVMPIDFARRYDPMELAYSCSSANKKPAWIDFSQRCEVSHASNRCFRGQNRGVSNRQHIRSILKTRH